MKTQKHILVFLGIILVLSFGLLSCGTSKKSAIACPPVSMNKNNKVALYHKRIKNLTITSYNRVSNKKQYVNLSRKKNGEKTALINNISVEEIARVPGIENVSYWDKNEYTKGLVASTDNAIIPISKNNAFTPTLNGINLNNHFNDLIIYASAGCDTIILKSGVTIIGKVEEIGQSEIKYRKCNNLTGPLISIIKADVSSIIYSNGTRDLFGPTDTYIPNQHYSTYNNNSVLKTEGLGLVGFISGLVGLFIASIPLGLIAVIFGGISLSKIKRQSQRFKGKGFAIASIILGIIDVVAMIILLAAI